MPQLMLHQRRPLHDKFRALRDPSLNLLTKIVGILRGVEKLRTTSLGLAEERIAWEGLASACSPPLRRLGAFFLVAFAAFVTTMTAVVLLYNIFGTRSVAGQGVSVPEEAFYVTMIFSLTLGLGGYLVWLSSSLRSYNAFSKGMPNNSPSHSQSSTPKPPMPPSS